MHNSMTISARNLPRNSAHYTYLGNTYPFKYYIDDHGNKASKIFEISHKSLTSIVVAYLLDQFLDRFVTMVHSQGEQDNCANEHKSSQCCIVIRTAGDPDESKDSEK